MPCRAAPHSLVAHAQQEACLLYKVKHVVFALQDVWLELLDCYLLGRRCSGAGHRLGRVVGNGDNCQEGGRVKGVGLVGYVTEWVAIP
jgi:hypothetical protein